MNQYSRYDGCLLSNAQVIMQITDPRNIGHSEVQNSLRSGAM